MLTIQEVGDCSSDANETGINTGVESMSHSLTAQNNNGENYDVSNTNSLQVLPSTCSVQQPSADIGEIESDDAEFNREMCLLLMDNRPQPIYSRKVFLGGLPLHISTDELQRFFSGFGPVNIGWPVAENNNEHDGYMFATFASADSVVKLVEKCVRLNGRLAISLPFSSSHSASIHVRVWYTRDAKYCSSECGDSITKNTRNCVFVGGIPRTMTAKQLSYFMSLTFGDVVFARIEVEMETDYPKGAGCVMFRDREAFVAAIASRFVPLNFGEHIKQIELQPYLMRLVECDICQTMKTRNFCPKLRCLKFMCDMCWKQAHVDMPEHQPLVRSPPLRPRPLLNQQSTAGDRGLENVGIIDPTAAFRSNWVRQGDAVNGARSLCQVVNSIQFPSITLFDSESESNTDWNTDCGIFDSHGPPPHAFRSRPSLETTHQLFIPRRLRGRSEPFCERNVNFMDQRNRWRGSPHKRNNNSRYKYYNSNQINCTAYGSTDYRHRLRCCHLSDSRENPNFFCSSRSMRDNQWSERICRISSDSSARAVIASNVSNFAKPRISFSPTVRRPIPRQPDEEAQNSTNSGIEVNENTNGNIVSAFAQFKLF
ncbi:hypothetical protein RB195_007742 [Necator americanus]|uniref:RRM domain-containing protein n=1 Tax=Necator americanus TaxID=51031 RepID=A0ABR1C1Y2_NECAM